MKDFTFTSESVSEGHSDKVCDQISDAILDHYIKENPESRTAIETVATTNRVILLGEASGPKSITHEVLDDIARKKIQQIGYQQLGFDWRKLKISNYIHEQSSDISQGISAKNNKPEGAGDQGVMFGYASNETDTLMPAPLHYCNRLLFRLSQARHKGKLSQLGPDAKAQISLKYIDHKPVEATSIVLSTQHIDSLNQEEVSDLVRPYIMTTLPDGWTTDKTQIHVNPTGRFVVGGPDGDTGMTGRKIVVDTYGGAAPHGGGAFSGKDPTKVDRSGAYMARYLAKNIVAAGLADRCTIQLSYIIGLAEPSSLYINTHGTGKIEDHRLAQTVRNMIALTPRNIRTILDLNKPIYARTAAYGHFGRAPDKDGGFSWERLDLVDQLKSEFM